MRCAPKGGVHHGVRVGLRGARSLFLLLGRNRLGSEPGLPGSGLGGGMAWSPRKRRTVMRRHQGSYRRRWESLMKGAAPPGRLFCPLNGVRRDSKRTIMTAHAGQGEADGGKAQVIEIPPQTTKRLTSVEFNTCLRHSAPVLIEKPIGIQHLKDAWGCEVEFLERFGDVEVTPRDPRRVAASGGAFRGGSRMTLREFFNRPPIPGRSGLLFSTVRDDLYRALTNAEPSYSWVPPGLELIKLRPVLSVAAYNGDGLGFHRHDESWLALVYGRKEWFLAPPEDPNPRLHQVSMTKDIPDNWRGIRVVQEAGDILYLPKGWWHATRNLTEDGKLCVGVGGMGDSPGIHSYIADGKLELCRDRLQVLDTWDAKAELFSILNARGMSVIHTASECENSRILSWTTDMLKKYTKKKKRELLHLRDNQQATPLHYASGAGSHDVCKWLIAQGVDLEAVDCHETTALHWSARGGCLTTLKHLVKVGADLEVQDIRGTTPLHLMAGEGHIRCVQYMLDEAGANISARDKQGMNASDWAIAGGVIELADLIRERLLGRLKQPEYS